MDTSRIRVDFHDEDVRNRVNRFLTSRRISSFRNLSVLVEHGTVTLSGILDSYYDKQVAISTCQRVAGVLGLIDEIQVKETRIAKPR